MTLLHTVAFRKTALASFIGLCISQSAFALQEISDDGLSETTGEGIALLPENFMMVFQGANDNPATMGTDSTNRSKDTGYIRSIPVGPLTQVAQDTNKDGLVNTSDHSVGKADIYMYGLALSAADGNTNNRFSNTPITSWGTPTNPWLLKVTTEKDVPNFSATTAADTGKGDVSYLMLEAPLYHADKDGNLTNGVNTGITGLTAAEKSAYNLKLGLWADAFVRDPNKPEGDAAQFHLGQNYGGASDSTRANRLRLQSVWDGFSLNGSNIKLFQTLGGATNTAGMSTSYNNTFGLAGVVRLNGGDGQNLRAGYTFASQSRTPSAWTNLSATECSQTLEVKCQFRFRERTVTDTQNGIVWTPPTAQSVLRLSTREASGASNANMLTTPATSGAMPTFDPSEGLYLYNANFNLVLGSLYQPLTFGVAPDNKNLVFELARIPNKATIYKQIYTAYAGATGTFTPEQIAEYKGSTCNIYMCGTNGTTDYQGNNATHSSITIGSTEYDAGTNRVTAYKGMESVGVSFGQLATQDIATASKTRYEVGFQQRQKTVVTGQFLDRYALKDNGWSIGSPSDPAGGSGCSGGDTCRRWWLRTGDAIHWAYLTAFNPTTGAKTWGDDAGKYTTAELFGTLPTNVTGTRGNITNPTGTVPTYTSGLMDCTNVGDALGVCQGTSGVGSDEGIYGLGVALRLASADNLNWVFGTRSDANTNDNKWFDANQDNTARAIYKEYYPSKSVETVPTAISAVNASPANNFGSAVIDGLLIQHMKITTKGL